MVVTIDLARIPVTVIVVVAAVLSVAVLIDAVAHHFLRATIACRIMVVTIVRVVVTVSVGVAEVIAIAVLVNAIATDLLQKWASARVGVIAVEILSDAISVTICRTIVPTIAIFVHVVARHFPRSRMHPRVVIVAINGVGVPIAVLVPGLWIRASAVPEESLAGAIVDGCGGSWDQPLRG